MKKHDEWYTHKRKKIIQRFINKCLDIDVLKSSEAFLDFLTNKNSKNATKNLKAFFDKTKAPEDASQYVTVTGEHDLIENPTIMKFAEKFSIYMTSYDILSSKFYSLSRQLEKQYEDISDTQQKLSECAKHLSTMFKLSNSDQLSEQYVKIETSLAGWSKLNSKYAECIKANFLDFYKYLTLEKTALNELNDLRNNFTTSYQKAEQTLTAKKEKLFKSGNTRYWELTEEDMKKEDQLKKDKDKAFRAMLPRETIKLNHLKMNYLMISNQ